MKKRYKVMMATIVCLMCLSVFTFSQWSNAQSGNALDFDGIDDYVEVVDDASLHSSAISFGAWIKLEHLPTTDEAFIIDKGLEYSLTIDETGKFGYLFYWDDSSGTYNPLAGGSVVAGAWTHLVIVYDGSYVYCYQDGLEVFTASLGKTLKDAGNKLWVGRRVIGVFEEPTDGVIDEVRIYNRALSPAEISDVFNGNPPTGGLMLELEMDEGSGSIVSDTSGHGNDGTIYGAQWVYISGLDFQIRTGSTQIITTVTWTGSDTATITLVSPSTTFDESEMTIYEKKTFDVSESSTSQYNIKRATLIVSATSTTEDWTLIVNGVTTYQANVEVT